jgi:cytochrome c-type protein NapB
MRIVPALLLVLSAAACDLGAPPERPGGLPLAANRLYSGAPPTIPHEVDALGRHDCLDCHAEGDAIAAGERAKITPHPELERCQQCHVTSSGSAPFVASEFEGWTYPLGTVGQPMGPLLIPHPLTMRENCLGCHGDHAEDPFLRTSHPERERCEQCHLPVHEGWPGPRPPGR